MSDRSQEFVKVPRTLLDDLLELTRNAGILAEDALMHRQPCLLNQHAYWAWLRLMEDHCADLGDSDGCCDWANFPEHVLEAIRNSPHI